MHGGCYRGAQKHPCLEWMKQEMHEGAFCIEQNGHLRMFHSFRGQRELKVFFLNLVLLTIQSQCFQHCKTVDKSEKIKSTISLFDSTCVGVFEWEKTSHPYIETTTPIGVACRSTIGGWVMLHITHSFLFGKHWSTYCIMKLYIVVLKTHLFYYCSLAKKHRHWTHLNFFIFNTKILF